MQAISLWPSSSQAWSRCEPATTSIDIANETNGDRTEQAAFLDALAKGLKCFIAAMAGVWPVLDGLDWDLNEGRCDANMAKEASSLVRQLRALAKEGQRRLPVMGKDGRALSHDCTSAKAKRSHFACQPWRQEESRGKHLRLPF